MGGERGSGSPLVERYSTLVSDAAPRRPDARHLRRSWRRSLAAWLPADRNAAILDIGCGGGAFLEFLRGSGYARLWGFDSSEEQVARCRDRGLDFVQRHEALEVGTFAGPEDGWDVIFCLDLLEHLPQERALGFLKEVRRRLATGGCVVIQTPNMAYLGAGWVLYGDPTHRAGYTELSLRAMLAAAGYASIDIRPHWYATTLPGRLRELYLRCLHRAVYLIEGRFAPRIATKNLLARAFKGKDG